MVFYRGCFVMKRPCVIFVPPFNIFSADCNPYQNFRMFRYSKHNISLTAGMLWLFMALLTSCSSSKQTSASRKNAGKPEQGRRTSVIQPPKDKSSDDPLESVIKGWIGTPYKYGGNTKAGTDCSGFVRAVFLEAYGIDLARSTLELLSLVQPISKSAIERGDLVFFEIEKAMEYHVGIYMGNQEFVHASSKKGVMVSRLDEPYFDRRYHAAGRVKRRK